MKPNHELRDTTAVRVSWATRQRLMQFWQTQDPNNSIRSFNDLIDSMITELERLVEAEKRNFEKPKDEFDEVKE